MNYWDKCHAINRRLNNLQVSDKRFTISDVRHAAKEIVEIFGDAIGD
jgi:hypothetical protein